MSNLSSHSVKERRPANSNVKTEMRKYKIEVVELSIKYCSKMFFVDL